MGTGGHLSDLDQPCSQVAPNAVPAAAAAIHKIAPRHHKRGPVRSSSDARAALSVQRSPPLGRRTLGYRLRSSCGSMRGQIPA